MFNPCSFPVEVVALDLDQRYQQDELVLQGVDEGRYNESNILYEVRGSVGMDREGGKTTYVRRT
jgi:hypothetical protein